MAGLAGWVQEKFNELRPDGQKMDTSKMRTAAQVVRDNLGYVPQSTPTVTQNAGYSIGDRGGAIVYDRSANPVIVENPDTRTPVIVTPDSGASSSAPVATTGGGGTGVVQPTVTNQGEMPIDYNRVQMPMGSNDQMIAMEQSLLANRDAFVQQQQAQLQHAMETEINALKSAYAQAIADGEISVRQADKEFEENVAAIQQKAYNDSKALAAQATELGINNSNQRMGMEYTQLANTNSLINKNVSERDLRIADIKSRLNAIKQQKDIAIAQAKSNYEYGVANAQSQADMQYNQNMFTLKQDDYKMDKQLQQQLLTLDVQQQYNVQNMNKQFEQTLQQMAVQNSYDVALQNSQVANQIKLMTAQASMAIEQESRQYAIELLRAEKALTPGTTEYKIAQSQVEAEIRQQMMEASTQVVAGWVAENNAKILQGEKLVEPIQWNSSLMRKIFKTDEKTEAFNQTKNMFEYMNPYYGATPYTDKNIVAEDGFFRKGLRSLNEDPKYSAIERFNTNN